eukprot:TRINITY_DN1013_c5_g1_i1.p1 TRINITY_DN1013_c5_g1~~TRINITY_DN1013_c5_g1_i1.p1  ORF type:complete len:314 (+),score=104.09 TRINITY_DN1013_c5_g1_i1:47-943(+)
MFKFTKATKFSVFSININFLNFKNNFSNSNLLTEKYLKVDRNPLQKGTVKLTGLKIEGTRKWYKNVTVEKIETKSNLKWSLKLDGREIETSSQSLLRFPTEALATFAACEWDFQLDSIKPTTMPILNIVTATIEWTPLNRDVIIGTLLQNLKFDSTCYSIFGSNRHLEPLYNKHIIPLHKWFSQRFNVPIQRPDEFFSEFSQPEQTIDVFRWYLHCLDDWSLTSLHFLCRATKSLIISMALLDGKITAEEATFISSLEEQSQLIDWQKFNFYHDYKFTELQLSIIVPTLFAKLLHEPN